VEAGFSVGLSCLLFANARVGLQDLCGGPVTGANCYFALIVG
jgi:hypothetical protein